jgi:lipopolysaccharide export system ATP-binding protein
LKEADDAVIRAEGLRVVAGGKVLLSKVDLAARRGEIIGIFGPNGAGKTTLVRVLAGDLAPASGRVLLGGADVTPLPLWQRARLGLGYIPQVPSVLFDLTVADNIRTFEEAARAGRRPPSEWTERFGLETKLAVRAKDLSGGERRRLELLRAMIGRPSVLLCDEPFAAGDPGHVRLAVEHLRSVVEGGGTVLIADHRMADALPICDRAVLLVEGSVEVLEAASGFADHPAVQSRYIG